MRFHVLLGLVDAVPCPGEELVDLGLSDDVQ